MFPDAINRKCSTRIYNSESYWKVIVIHYSSSVLFSPLWLWLSWAQTPYYFSIFMLSHSLLSPFYTLHPSHRCGQLGHSGWPMSRAIDHLQSQALIPNEILVHSLNTCTQVSQGAQPTCTQPHMDIKCWWEVYWINASRENERQTDGWIRPSMFMCCTLHHQASATFSSWLFAPTSLWLSTHFVWKVYIWF